MSITASKENPSSDVLASIESMRTFDDQPSSKSIFGWYQISWFNNAFGRIYVHETLGMAFDIYDKYLTFSGTLPIYRTQDDEIYPLRSGPWKIIYNNFTGGLSVYYSTTGTFDPIVSFTKVSNSKELLRLNETLMRKTELYTTPEPFFNWFKHSKKILYSSLHEKYLGTDGEIKQLFCDEILDKTVTNKDFLTILSELENGVTRKANVKSIKYAGCMSEEGQGIITTQDSVVTLIMHVPDKTKGEYPYLPCVIGEKLMVTGTGIPTLDGKECRVASFGFNDGYYQSDKAAPKHHLDNWHYLSLELPITIRNISDAPSDVNNYLWYNTGVYYGNIEAAQQDYGASFNPDMFRMYSPEYTVNDIVVSAVYYYYGDQTKNMKFEINPGTYTSTELKNAIIGEFYESHASHPNGFNRIVGHQFSLNDAIPGFNGPYGIRGRRDIDENGNTRGYPMCILKDSPLAITMGINNDNWPEKDSSDNMYVYQPFAAFNYGFIGTDDFTWSGTPTYKLYTPLSAGEIALIDNGVTTGNVEVTHGPIDNRLLKDPNGYVNFVGCLAEVYKATCIEEHGAFKVWGFWHSGEFNRNRIPDSWNDLNRMLDVYGVSSDLNVSSTDTLRIRPFGTGFAGECSTFYASGRMTYVYPQQSGSINDEPLPQYVGYYSESEYTQIPYGNVEGLDASNRINIDENGKIVGFLGDWTARGIHQSAGRLDIPVTNYLEMPYTLMWTVDASSGQPVNKLVEWPRFVAKPDGYSETPGNIVFGVVKESHVRRILQIPDATPSNEVPRYGYFNNYQGTGNFGISSLSYGIYDPIIATHGTGSRGGGINIALCAWFVEWFNRQNCTNIINDIRNELGGWTYYDDIMQTFGTLRDKPNSNIELNNTQDHMKSIKLTPGDIAGVRSEKHKFVDEMFIGKETSMPPTRKLNPNMFDTPELQGALFDRDPNVYQNLDTSLNPNTDVTKKIMVLDATAPLSATQLHSFSFKGQYGDGYHYFNEQGERYHGNVEVLSMGQLYNPFWSAGGYPPTSDELGMEVPRISDEVLPVWPVQSATRTDAYGFHTHDGYVTGDTYKYGAYHDDFHIDSTYKTFHQDIGLTKEIMNDPRFKALGGKFVMGQVNYSQNVSQQMEGTPFIAPSPDAPNFFDKRTWRDRIMERAIKIMGDSDWKKMSLKHGMDQNPELSWEDLKEMNRKYATVNF